MRYPKFLQEKGTIGFVAPSFGCNTEPYKTAFDSSLEKFKALGHGLDLGPNCYEGKGIGISNTPEACGKELTEYYCSVDNDVLISCGGGELMCETMSCVDFDAIKAAEPKWYMGYSDNTNMTFLLTTLCDTAAIYGPCAQTFGMEPWDVSLQDTYDLLRGKRKSVSGYKLWEKEPLKDKEHPLVPYNLTEERNIRVFTPGAAGEDWSDFGGKEKPDAKVQLEGRLVGGCMDCLVNLLGTKFDDVKGFNERYKEDGIIWFVESCDLNVMAIRRAIWQMKNADWFQYVKGFLIGRPLCFGQDIMGLDQYHAVVDLLKDYNVPVIMDLDIGHLAPMMPMISGAYAKVDVKGNDITIFYEYK
ncbi:MAG: LD-carboxypeptidase [Roseburia sp.]|nr:LD-carboxypeptidase [Roseburia sp.]